MLFRPIAYLENDDINNSGQLVNPNIPNIPVVVMLQASWCPHCTNAKPAFQNFANKYENKVFCATIQSDGDRATEKELGNRSSKIIPDFKGFPHYALYINGNLVQKEIQGREVEDLEKFVKM
jgi:thiol-disulfide isomerase/thioredoxin